MGGRGLFEFEEMQQTYLAIKDLDSVIKGQSTTKLEDAWNVLQQISKDKFAEVYVNNILDNMRAALVKMYTDIQKSIDSSINLHNHGESTHASSDQIDALRYPDNLQVDLPSPIFTEESNKAAEAERTATHSISEELSKLSLGELNNFEDIESL